MLPRTRYPHEIPTDDLERTIAQIREMSQRPGLTHAQREALSRGFHRYGDELLGRCRPRDRCPLNPPVDSEGGEI